MKNDPCNALSCTALLAADYLDDVVKAQFGRHASRWETFRIPMYNADVLAALAAKESADSAWLAANTWLHDYL